MLKQKHVLFEGIKTINTKVSGFNNFTARGTNTQTDVKKLVYLQRPGL